MAWTVTVSPRRSKSARQAPDPEPEAVLRLDRPYVQITAVRVVSKLLERGVDPFGGLAVHAPEDPKRRLLDDDACHAGI